MALSKRVSRLALVSFLAAGATFVVDEGSASAQKRRPKKAAPTAQPATAPSTDSSSTDSSSASAPAATPATSQPTTPPEAAPAEEAPKKELDTSVEADKAVYLSGDVGFTRTDLGALSDSTGFDRTAANGLLYGVGTGLRLRDLRLGLRWRVYDTTEFALWSFALSAGYALPIRPVTPIFSAHVGYVWDQNLQAGLFKRSLPPGSAETSLPPDVDVKGLLAGVDVNLSYWVTQFLRLGVFVGADFMFLSREKAPLPTSIFGVPPEYSALPLYSGSGSSVGLNVNAGLRMAFDIGIK